MIAWAQNAFSQGLIHVIRLHMYYNSNGKNETNSDFVPELDSSFSITPCSQLARPNKRGLLRKFNNTKM